MQVFVNHVRWDFWCNAIHEVYKSLTDNHIGFLVLKGWAFAADLYPDIGERSFGDVDILLHVQDFGRVYQIFSGLGFQEIKSKNQSGTGQQFSLDLIPLVITFQNVKGITIDVHSHIITSYWSLPLYPIEVALLWAHKQKFDSGSGVPIYRLSWEHTFLHLVSHIVRHGMGMQVRKSYIDLDRLIRKFGPTLNWEEIFHLSEVWGLRVGFQLVMNDCVKWFQTPFPSVINEVKLTRKVRLRLINSCLPLTKIQNLQKNPWLFTLLGKLLLVDKPLNIFKLAWRAILPSRLLRLQLYGKKITLIKHWFIVSRYGLKE